jgi:hypothetical protein
VFAPHWPCRQAGRLSLLGTQAGVVLGPSGRVRALSRQSAVCVRVPRVVGQRQAVRVGHRRSGRGPSSHHVRSAPPGGRPCERHPPPARASRRPACWLTSLRIFPKIMRAGVRGQEQRRCPHARAAPGLGRLPAQGILATLCSTMGRLRTAGPIKPEGQPGPEVGERSWHVGTPSAVPPSAASMPFGSRLRPPCPHQLLGHRALE